jgi:hypothetical protein
MFKWTSKGRHKLQRRTVTLREFLTELTDHEQKPGIRIIVLYNGLLVLPVVVRK